MSRESLCLLGLDTFKFGNDFGTLLLTDHVGHFLATFNDLAGTLWCLFKQGGSLHNGSPWRCLSGRYLGLDLRVDGLSLFD